MNKKIILLILCIIIIALVVGFSSNKATSSAVRIGVILPMTGKAASYGEQVKSGIDIALKDVNKDGQKVEIVYEDNQFDPKLGLSAYEKLTKFQNIKYLITFGGNVCPYINPLAQKDKVVNFATGCNTLDFKDQFSYNFRFDVAESEASKAVVNYVKETWSPKTVGLLYPNNDWGTIVSKTIKDALVEKGIEVSGDESYIDGNTDVKTQLTKIKDANPDAVFFLSLSNFTPSLLKQIDQIGIDKPLFTNISIQDPNVIKNAGTLAEGIVYSAPKLIQIDNAQNQSFNAVFPDPNSRNFASWGFDSVNLFAEAFVAAGNNPEKVAKYLHGTKNYPGAFGVINYDNSGELSLDYAIKAIKEGKFVEVK